MIKSIFGGRRKKSTPTPACNSNNTGNDREEDGFVLLGETAVERSTVGPAAPTSTWYTDRPPSYESQVYNYNSSLIMGQQASSAHQGSSGSSSLTPPADSGTSGQMNTGPGPSPMSLVNGAQGGPGPDIGATSAASISAPRYEEPVGPLTGVPFRLSPLLEAQLQPASRTAHLPTPLRPLNLNSYDYDFSLEKTVMRNGPM